MNNHYIETKDDLFDPQLVRCVWDDALDGMRCFAADHLDDLRELVRSGNESRRLTLQKTEPDEVWTDYPFRTEEGPRLRYAYYDPYYGMKLAYLNGAQIQYINRRLDDDDWQDCSGPCWNTDEYDYRVRPEPEPEWRPFESVREMLDTLDPEGNMHGIWLAIKRYPETELLVTGLDCSDNTVKVEDDWYTMQELFEGYLVNDGPVGIKETKE